MRCSSSTQIEVLSNEMEHRPYRPRGLELSTRSGVESPKTGSGVMAKLNAKVELAQLLDAATTHEADSLAVESDLMNRMRMIVDQWPPASLDEQRTDLLADMRELLRLTVNDPTVVDSR
jgi:hypothetical protein